MKKRFLNAYTTKLVFFIVAGIAAVVILQLRALSELPAKLRGMCR